MLWCIHLLCFIIIQLLLNTSYMQVCSSVKYTIKAYENTCKQECDKSRWWNRTWGYTQNLKPPKDFLCSNMVIVHTLMFVFTNIDDIRWQNHCEPKTTKSTIQNVVLADKQDFWMIIQLSTVCFKLFKFWYFNIYKIIALSIIIVNIFLSILVKIVNKAQWMLLTP